MNNLNGKNLCNPHAFMRHRRANGSIHPGIMVLKPNTVWMGCPNKPCKNEVAIKQCTEHEYHVQRTMKEHFPTLVPKVYGGKRCGDGKFYMYSEYIRNGTVKKHANDTNIGVILYKVFLALKKIHDKYPSFRHNDLHTDNVLIDGDRPLLYDFGYANWYGNPIFDTILKNDYGIFPGNHQMYDFHFFANSVYSDLPQKYRNIVLKVFPVEYLGENSSVIKNGRLRCDVDHKNLPTMDQVIKAFVPNTKPKLLVMSSVGAPKKANIAPPKKMSPRVKFSLRNKERARNQKAKLMRNEGMNEIEAEMKAIKIVEKLKLAGLLTPSPSPKKTVAPKPKVMVVKRSPVVVAVAGPSRPVPVVTYTNTPRIRPRIDKKLCTSYKKDELMSIMKRLGHRVDKRMTLKEMCSKLSSKKNTLNKGVPLNNGVPLVVYTRPMKSPILNVRKMSYPKVLKKNLVRLAKNVGIDVKSKDKKGEITNKIYKKLNKNVSSVLKKSNKKTVTARKIAETLAKNYGWKNDRHVERVRLLKIYSNGV